MTARQIYRLIHDITDGGVDDEVELLKIIVSEIVEHSQIVISGARIWELDEASAAYILRAQAGAMPPIPHNFSVRVQDHPVFRSLQHRQGVVDRASDSDIAGGIQLFTAVGVGPLVKYSSHSLYRFAVSFNAPQTDELFFETIHALGSIITLRLVDISRRRETSVITRELRQAWEIQQSLLPSHNAEFLDWEVYGVSIPDKIVGGDYFDYLKPLTDPEERLSIVISDAASKGLSAAVQALFVSGALRMGAGFQLKMSSLIARLNALIYDTFPYERFVTLFYCELMRSTQGLVLFVNAGHCSPQHYRVATGDCVALPSTGSVLGIMPEQHFQVGNINMDHGDILVLYTDGINEAQNGDREFFGDQRIRDCIARNSTLPAQAIALALLQEVQTFSASGKYTDDKTLVVVKRLPKNQS